MAASERAPEITVSVEGAGDDPVTGAVRDCPECRSRGRPVSRATVAAIVPGPVPRDGRYFLCPGPECGLLYFGDEGDRIPVDATPLEAALKSDADRALVCFCFLVRRRDVTRAVSRADESRLLGRIQDEMRAGRCACEVRNPTGRCCLSELRRLVESTRGEQSAPDDG